MTVHSQACIEYTERLTKANAEYESKHPNYCRSCSATGMVTWYESVPYGMGSTSMPMGDICETCLGKNKCPRCGEVVWTDDDVNEADKLVCPKCGWNDEEPGCPPLPDGYCSCEAEEEDRLAREYDWS